MVSDHWIGSLGSVTGRGWRKLRSPLANIIALLLVDSPFAQPPLKVVEVPDEQRRLAGRGYNGRAIRVDG